MGPSVKVVVVGGGIIGLCSAYELLKRGHSVTVIDDSFEEGCSYGNGGIIVPSHFVPIASPEMLRLGLRLMTQAKGPFGLAQIPNLEMLSWIVQFALSSTSAHVQGSSTLLKDLNLKSKELFEEMLEKVGVEAGFAKKGLLMVCKTQHSLNDEVEFARTAESLGLKTTVCDKGDLERLEPNVEMDAVGGVLFADDAHLTPSVVMAVLKPFLVASGVELLKGLVTGMEVQEKQVNAVTTSQGAITADTFVFCVGVYTPALSKLVGLKLPMLSGRGYGITLPPTGESWNHPAILVESRIAVTPMVDGVRFVGVLELGPPVERAITPRFEGMMEAIPSFYPRVDPAQLRAAKVWTGHRPCTPDGLPYLGKSSKLGNAIWAAGHAMMGMSLGPVTGRIVAQIADSEKPDFPLQLLSPDRYDK